MTDGIGKQLALRTETRKNCQTCKLGYNYVAMVHRMSIDGSPISDIHSRLVEMQYDQVIRKAPSRTSLTNHLKNHLNIKDAAIREIVNRRAAEQGKDLDRGVENLLTDIAVAESIVKMGFEKIVSGQMPLEARDVLAANKQLHDFKKDSQGGLDATTAMLQVGMITQAVREIVPDSMWLQIVNRIKEISEQNESDSYIDAEIVD